jgi:hypothetical protein
MHYKIYHVKMLQLIKWPLYMRGYLMISGCVSQYFLRI